MNENERRVLHERVLHEFTAMGFKPEKVESLRLIEQALANTLCHIAYAGSSFVMKVYPKAANAVEITCYDIFNSLNIPTLRVFGRTAQALLLEDLDTSQALRMAHETDMASAWVGAAVAEWYLRLHEGGRQYVKAHRGAPPHLKRDADELNAAGILETGKRLGLEALPVWKLAAVNIDALKAAVRSRAETILHNDFYWANLALSRNGQPECAVAFDYHLARVGMAYSDCRAIASKLGETARSAFWERYGAVNEKERILDTPVRMLYALFDLAPFDKSRFPKYGREYLEQTERGELERTLKEALEVL